VASQPERGTWFTPLTEQEELLSNFLTGGPPKPARVLPPAAVAAAAAAAAAANGAGAALPGTPLPTRAPLVPRSVRPGAAVNPDAPAASAAAPGRPAGDRSPIFESLQSEWFVRPDEAPEEQAWQSPGDAGWRRAAELRTTTPAVPATSDGLPVRVPGRNLIAGSADEEQPAPAPVRDPRRTGGLSGFQQGVSRARTIRPVDPREPLETPHPTEEAAQ